MDAETHEKVVGLLRQFRAASDREKVGILDALSHLGLGDIEFSHTLETGLTVTVKSLSSQRWIEGEIAGLVDYAVWRQDHVFKDSRWHGCDRRDPFSSAVASLEWIADHECRHGSDGGVCFPHYARAALAALETE